MLSSSAYLAVEVRSQSACVRTSVRGMDAYARSIAQLPVPCSRYSLFRGQKFPDLLRLELATRPQAQHLRPSLRLERPLRCSKFPVNFPVSREFGRGDRFAAGLRPQPATRVSVTRFPGVAEVPTFQRVRLIRASLLEPVQRRCGRNGPVCVASLRALFFNFRFAMPETGSTGTETGQRS